MKLARNPAAKTRRQTVTGFLWCLIPAVFVVPLAAQEKGRGREASSPSDSATTLMFVREWDPHTGILTGWMPSHFAAVQLELLNKKLKPHFEPDEAVYLKFPGVGKNKLGEIPLRASPTPRVFEGESWLPTKHDPNLVRIGKDLYLLRSVILNSAKWRQPAKASAAGSSAADVPAR